MTRQAAPLTSSSQSPAAACPELRERLAGLLEEVERRARYLRTRTAPVLLARDILPELQDMNLPCNVLEKLIQFIEMAVKLPKDMEILGEAVVYAAWDEAKRWTRMRG